MRREYADNTQHCTDRAPLWGEAVLLVRDYSTPMSMERAREWRASLWCGEPVPHSPEDSERSGADFARECSTPRRFESGCGVEIQMCSSRRDCAAGCWEWKGGDNCVHIHRPGPSCEITLICCCYCAVQCFPPPSLFALRPSMPRSVIFGPYKLLAGRFALQRVVMWQSTLESTFSAWWLIFHSTAKAWRANLAVGKAYRPILEM